MRMHRPNHRLLKTHRSYSVEGADRLLGLRKNAVWSWVRAALPNGEVTARPMLIPGREAQAPAARTDAAPTTCDALFSSLIAALDDWISVPFNAVPGGASRDIAEVHRAKRQCGLLVRTATEATFGPLSVQLKTSVDEENELANAMGDK